MTLAVATSLARARSRTNFARGERVEQELAPHLTLGARPELLAQACERRLALAALGQPEIEALQERLDPTLDERCGHVEGVAREHLIDEPLADGGVRARHRLPLEVRAHPRAQLGERVTLPVVAGEVVVERRQLLHAELLDLHLERGGLPGEPGVGIVRGIRDAQREPRAAALAHELPLEGEREAARASLEKDALSMHRLAALQAAGQVDAHHVPRLDLRAILHRAELGDRFPELTDGALDVLVAHARRG